MDGKMNMSLLRDEMMGGVTQAATQAGEVLRPDWKSLFECTDATDVLFDITAIFENTAESVDISNSIAKVYKVLNSDEAREWTLESVCKFHADSPAACMYARPLAKVFTFFKETLAFSHHTVATLFEDNHIALLRNTFCLIDGSARYSAGRLSLVAASSGASKSPLFGTVNDVLTSDEVKAAFSSAEGSHAASSGISHGKPPKEQIMKVGLHTRSRTMHR